jgi:PKD repeat protein
MKLISFVVAALSAALLFGSCSETVGTNGGGNNNAAHTLLVSPDTDHLLVYEQDTFKVRATNMPASELLFDWDFGDKNYIYPLDESSSRIFHTYSDTGNYTIHVRATDYFNDTLVAEKSIDVHVGLPSRDVDIYPHLGDTLVATILYGDYLSLPLISFFATSDLASNTVSVEWNFGDNSNDTTVKSSSSCTHYFPGFGTYVVRAKVFDKYGNFWGSDSETITIREPKTDLSSIVSKGKISIILYLDSTVSFFYQLPFQGFQLALPIVNDSVNTSSWNSTSLILHHEQQFEAPSLYFEDVKYDMAARLSSDLRSIDALSLSFLDSIETPYEQKVKYGFNLKNLMLFGTNDSMVVYMTSNRPLNDFSSDIIYSSSNMNVYPYGNPPQSYWYPPLRRNPSAMVIFSKR